MVGLITSSSVEYKVNSSATPGGTTSVDASYSDPDLLIKEYFSSSSAQRAISRKAIIKRIKTPQSIFAILSWGASGKARDGYDGAVNLLAETNNLELLKSVSQNSVKIYMPMLGNTPTRNFAENSLEILIKAIACAYKIDADQRLKLLTDIFPQIDRRMIKVAVIDALTIISDDADLSRIKATLEHFTSHHDQYVCDYAADALQDIS
jgi:hypothetical protein